MQNPAILGDLHTQPCAVRVSYSHRKGGKSGDKTDIFWCALDSAGGKLNLFHVWRLRMRLSANATHHCFVVAL